MITRNEIEVIRGTRERSTKALIDVYLAYVHDREKVEAGADIRYVVEELRKLNRSVLKTELGAITPICLWNHYEMSRELLTLKLSEIADRGEWSRAPGEIWRGVCRIVAALVIYFRRCWLPWQAPVLTSAELNRLRQAQ